ncbi:MAG: DUF4375 domain-containing protein [Clostridia bacterium]|nr:DUF4375 domain-containing protein [Clostridia bacterium]
MPGFFKSFFALRRSIKKEKRNQKRFLEMSSDELKSLSGHELFSAVLCRTESKVDKYENIIDGVKALNGTERVFYVTSYYEMEVNNGGLCQFFVNSSREIAPELSECLGIIGASEHKNLFDSFVSDNGIDVSDLSSFMIDDSAEFEAQTKRYPFDDFDNAFYKLEPIQDRLIPYIKDHISEF